MKLNGNHHRCSNQYHTQAIGKNQNQFHYNYDLTELGEFLGISKQKILIEKSKGLSLSEIANKNHISNKKLIGYLSKRFQESLDSSLSKGQIDSDIYNAIKRDINTHVNDDIHFSISKFE